jgi:hypothetical protein
MRDERSLASIAVALHDIEPATFERCALIRDWLDDHGVDRVTLLVIPARDLHPLADRGPALAQWLRERERRGDAIAQHGFRHLQSRPQRWRAPLAPAIEREQLEFIGLDARDTARALDAGRRVLKLAGIEPRGFVAPGYAYTQALHETIATRFCWWAGRWRLYGTAIAGGRPISAPAIGLAATGPLRRSLGHGLLWATAMLNGSVLRVDLHPADLAFPSRMLALERVLSRAAPRRVAVTYEQLTAAGQSLAPAPPLARR